MTVRDWTLVPQDWRPRGGGELGVGGPVASHASRYAPGSSRRATAADRAPNEQPGASQRSADWLVNSCFFS
jgi:hypothetical protein